jgi:hypothetical protein
MSGISALQTGSRIVNTRLLLVETVGRIATAIAPWMTTRLLRGRSSGKASGPAKWEASMVWSQNYDPLNNAWLSTIVSNSRTRPQELGKSLKSSLGDVVLDAFSIGLCGFCGHAHCE